MSESKKIDETIQALHKEGLRFLFLFKILKIELQMELAKKNKRLSNAIIDKVCAEAAKDLLVKHEQTPTKEEISNILERLPEKMKP